MKRKFVNDYRYRWGWMTIAYYLDDRGFTLEDLKKRIMETDLIPSRASLLENIDEVFIKLAASGLKTLTDLRKRLKTPKHIASFADESGIGIEYLTLLRREIESYFPKAFPLKDFDWIPETARRALEEAGYTNSQKLYETLNPSDRKKEISTALGIDKSLLEMITGLVDITRVQWMSPLSARLMYEAGYTSASSIRTAIPEELYKAVESVNMKNRYFRGKIGLRDIKRLVHAAKYAD